MDFANLPSITRFLAARLKDPLPGPDAQRELAPRPLRENWRPELVPPQARTAAGLILLYPGPQGATLPLTVRHVHLPHHPGQVSLPGGRTDDGEPADRAALREAHEEIGVAPSLVRLLGPLSTLWVPVSNHVIHPFVGVTDRVPAFALAAGEVESLVEVPVADLRDPARRGREPRMRDGHAVQVPFFSLSGHRVWGATAMILSEFAALFEEGERVKG